MKTITAEMRTHLDGELTSICTCWKITRQDGERFCFTDHDHPLTIDGDLYKASTGFTRSAIVSDATLSADNMEIDGFLDDESITEDDLRIGKFDYADVEVFAVNWQNISDGIVKLRKGLFGEIQVMPSGLFKVELRGLTQLFAMQVGEIYAPECRTDLGSDKCKVPLNATAYVLGASYPRNARVRVVFDELRYGHNVPLINRTAALDGDSYTGNPFGWQTNSTPSLYRIEQNNLMTPYEGLFVFQPLDAQWYWQNYPFSRLPPALRPNYTSIDAGDNAHTITFKAWVFLPFADTEGEIGLSWCNASGVRLTVDPEADLDMTDDFPPDIIVDTTGVPVGEWTEIDVSGTCPPGTRVVRPSLRVIDTLGPGVPVIYFDAMTLTMSHDPGTGVVETPLDIYNGGAELANPDGNGGTMPGWTHRTNRLYRAEGNLNVTPQSGIYMFRPEGDEWFWQDVLVTNSPGIVEADIDEELYFVEFSIRMNNTEPGHRGRVGLRFFDASMNRIFPQEGFADTAMTRDVPNDAVSDLKHNTQLRTWETRTVKALIPAGTRIIRYMVYRDVDTDADVVTPSMFMDDASARIWDKGYEQVEKLAGASNYELLAIQGGTTGNVPPDWSSLVAEGDTIADGTVIWRLTLATYIHTGEVESVTNRNRFVISGLPAIPKRTFVNDSGTVVEQVFPVSQFQFYRYGLVHFETGQNAGQRIEIKNWNSATREVTVFLPFLRPITPGDRLSIWVGCGKSTFECHNKFNNIINFRGEPEVPGQDQYFKIGGAP